MSSYKQLKENVNHYVGNIKHAVLYSVDNTFIHSGYRINYNTPWLTVKSLFHKHNELINIWTHVIGALLAFLLILQIALFADGNRNRLENDIEQIFTIPSVTESKFTEIITKIEYYENEVITSEHYKELVQLIGNATEYIAPEGEFLAQNTKELSNKLQKIRQKIVQQVQQFQFQIDSEEFDWLEIYKYSYPHAPIIRQLQINRVVADPLHISRWPIVVFLISSIFCMAGSAMFHLFYQMNEKANKYLMRVDYGGISLLILGSCFPPFFYGFYCDFYVRYFYLFFIGSACLAAYIISIFDFIHTEKWRRVKGIMYGSLGLFAGVPAIHLYMREFYHPDDSDYLPFKHSFIYYILMGGSYLGGLAIYVLRIPERFKPGKFDLIGHSHQIWHCCVFMGVVFSYIGAIYNLEDRRYTFCIL